MANLSSPGSPEAEPYPGLGVRRDSTLKLIASPVDYKTQERAEAMDLRARTNTDSELLGHRPKIHSIPEFVKVCVYCKFNKFWRENQLTHSIAPCHYQL
jgi:hypothetical protein